MTYNFIKLIHLISVIIFLGNIFTGLYWMHISVKTNDIKTIYHSISGVIKSDKLFTIPGVILITTGGLIAAIYGNIPILRTGWILWSIIFFSISGIVFAWKVVPLQKKIYNLTSSYENNSNFDWVNFNKVYSKWEIWGLIALVTPVISLIMMVLKIPD